MEPMLLLLPLSSWFDKTGIYSVNYITNVWLMNTPFITFTVLLYYIKDLTISFSRVIIIQDFKTVIFYVLLLYKLIFSAVFC